MVENKNAKREKDIKSKLMAAIAMLLVSSIMMVSTSYAWFTLSTAPEVTGIQTAVGANGNLEMALLPNNSGTSDVENADGSTTTVTNYYTSASDAMAAIKTGSADSFSATNDKTLTNITWGNLVDLNHQSYGMSKIKLYPSTLNDDSGTLTEGSMLSIPVYGSDGRVAKLTETGTTGTFDGIDSFYAASGYGVRAVGKVSGLSARETAYNTAVNMANSAAGRANTAASASLNIGGNALASIAMKHAQNSGAKFTDDEIKPLADTYAHLLGEGGAITEIETALRQYIIASAVAEATDEEYAGLVTGLTAATWDELKTEAPDAVDAMIDKVVALRKTITDAQESVNKQIDATDEHEWNDVYSALKILGNTETMKLNGYVLDYWLGRQDKDGNAVSEGIRYAELMAAYSSLKLVIEEEGIYVEMADFCGKISASVTMNVNYDGNDIPVSPVMEANPTVTPSYLATAKKGVTEFAKDETSTVKNPISDFYGYIVDLAFRTNAADSYLKLQTEAENRIYEGNSANAEVMGGGSTMSYSYYLENNNYNGENIKKLMSGVRVVFFDPADGEIIAYAKLDMDNNVSNVEITDDDGNVIGYTLTAKLKLTVDDGGEFRTGDAADKLMDLNQNISTALSALVYLDGYAIGNDAVSTTDIEGTMNLQFSSSADLIPMSYSDLQNGAATSTETSESGSDAGDDTSSDGGDTTT